MCEYIAIRSETQGTEPSKYLEEKTSTAGREVSDEIPSVAASERGRAQTTRPACGVVGPAIVELQTGSIAERHWEGRPQEVKAL